MQLEERKQAAKKPGELKRKTRSPQRIHKWDNKGNKKNVDSLRFRCLHCFACLGNIL